MASSLRWPRHGFFKMIKSGLFFLLFLNVAGAMPPSLAIKNEPPAIKTCESFSDFKQAYEYLKKQADLNIPDTRMLGLSVTISKGCTGAANRFVVIYETLKKSGVSIEKSIEVALDFAHDEEVRVQNFANVFKRIFLENYFDFDFSTAFRISLELSRDLEANVDEVRTDFVNLVKFCVDNKSMDLPTKLCADYALLLVKHSKLYPKTGLYSYFTELYGFLRDHEKLGLNIKEALRVIPEVLSYGPTATKNFKETFNYSVSKEVSLTAADSLKMAVLVARNSLPTENEDDKK